MHMRDVLEAHADLLRNSAGPGNFAPRPADRPLTKFEQRGQRLGHAVYDLIYLRC
jgi:tRNA (guanine-N7-)-methyltransferase